MEQLTYQELKAERDLLRDRVCKLEEENLRLKKQLGETDIVGHPVSSFKSKFSLQEKVDLFRNLFKGREDVFARRWFSRTTGKSGYQPVCGNEWNAHFCDKKKFKCAECLNRQFSPLTDADIFNHLSGKDEEGRDVVGIYAIKADNTCDFLCADFDDKNCEHGYQEDVLAFVEVCKQWRIPYSIERSRSGKGAHVWLFFESPIAAVKARKLGNAILTEAMNHNGRISFKSYDRFIPNQDYLPEGGFGNLIALPLQGKARKEGNSVFVDEEFQPYEDQWIYVHGVKRISEDKLDEIISNRSFDQPMGELSKTSESKPWELPSAPQFSRSDFSVDFSIVKSNMLYIPIEGLSAKALNHFKRIASFKNPEFYSRQAMRLSTFSTPRIISCADITEGYLSMPRGCEDAIRDFLQEKGIETTWVNETYQGKNISVKFNGTLKEDQVLAIKYLCAENNGVLSATTAFGKTVTAIGMIAELKVNTLILVHTKALLDQWKCELEKFLTVEYVIENQECKRGQKKISPIGSLCSLNDNLRGIIDVATIQSCINENEVKPFVRNYGMVIVDECHHVSAVSFEQVLKTVCAQRVYGLTATPIRKDGHQPIIFMQCGPIRYCADTKTQMKEQTFQRMLVPRFTSYRLLTDDKQTYAQTIQQLADDECRNRLIINDIREALKQGRSPIVLTNLTSHVAILADLLRPHCENVITLIGSESAKLKRQKMDLLHSVPTSNPFVIVATGKYVGEGFDFPRLDTLFLSLPISWKGLVAQYAGRLHREYEGKQEVLIYDYVDIHVPVCEIMYRKRLKGYAAVGYSIKKDSKFSSEESGIYDNIYDGKTFVNPFISSMSKAKRSVIIASPKIKLGRYSVIADRLRDLVPTGIHINVITKAENDDVGKLRSNGIQITLNPNINFDCCLIDKSCIWYGSVSILGFHSAEDNIIMFQDEETAMNIRELLLKPL
ncbi:MAG: DEAD/DEAH box helicase family protein [Paludibacteraceae bacterium]|nr:DEAD/DEAH box helicase family protein [Paludibacteraceae bacterium]